MSEFPLRDYFRTQTAVLRALYAHTQGLGASRNKGNLREWFCQEFLTDVLPRRLSVESGEILDSCGGRTGEMDLLVVWDYCPRLAYWGRERVCLVEGVCAAIEVKSKLDRSQLRRAVKTLRRVEQLQVKGLKASVVAGSKPLLRPMRILVAYEGATPRLLREELENLDAFDTVDLLCVLSRGVFISHSLGLSSRKDDPYPWYDDPVLALTALVTVLCQAAGNASSVRLEMGPYLTSRPGADD